MLPKHLRLTHKELVSVKKIGQKYSSVSWRIIILYSPLSYSRLYVHVFPSFDKRATKRNRMKRIIQEAFLLSHHTWSRSVDMIIEIKKSLPIHTTKDAKEILKKMIVISHITIHTV
jgi:ribonuclease P protein component